MIAGNKIFSLAIYFIKIYPVIAAFLFIGCANQLPPGGGEEDKTPPKVKIISPKPNSTNFNGNSLIFEFNEYVDRRSFQDAFRISPHIEGDIEYNWSGTEVEVEFPNRFSQTYPSKTFVVNISSSLKDIRGNAITTPVNFAFSTGSRIDMGGVKGRVYNNNNKIAAVLAYNTSGSGEFNPSINLPDYLTETSTDGNYELTNLAPGNYRIITIFDEDRNLLFTSERESYGVLPFDVNVADSMVLSNINFYMFDLTQKNVSAPELDYSKYFKDSLNIVYTSVESGSDNVLPDQSIFIFFSRFKPQRGDFISSFKVTDENGAVEKMVFNWKNDSLVEVFSADKFANNKKYILTFNVITPEDSVYAFRLPFRTVSANSFGDLKGRINANYEDIINFPVKIELTAKNVIPALKYTYEVKDSVFSLKNILETEYAMFSFIDKNSSGSFDYGYPYPFVFSEQFYVYPASINIKGGWTVENVVINFVK